MGMVLKCCTPTWAGMPGIIVGMVRPPYNSLQSAPCNQIEESFLLHLHLLLNIFTPNPGGKYGGNLDSMSGDCQGLDEEKEAQSKIEWWLIQSMIAYRIV